MKSIKNKKNKIKKNKNRNSKKNKSIRKIKNKGGATFEQIGRAAVMRSWLNDEKLFKELSKIVHSGDRDPHHFYRTGHDNTSFNNFADLDLQEDPNAEKLLKQMQKRYEKSKSYQLMKLRKQNVSRISGSPSLFTRNITQSPELTSPIMADSPVTLAEPLEEPLALSRIITTFPTNTLNKTKKNFKTSNSFSQYKSNDENKENIEINIENKENNKINIEI